MGQEIFTEKKKGLFPLERVIAELLGEDGIVAVLDLYVLGLD